MVATALSAFLACHARRIGQAIREDDALADDLFRDLRILCVGMGGGTLPLFLAHHFPSCVLKVIEIDPKVGELGACLALTVLSRYTGFIFRGCVRAGSAPGRRPYGIPNRKWRRERQPIKENERFTWY